MTTYSTPQLTVFVSGARWVALAVVLLAACVLPPPDTAPSYGPEDSVHYAAAPDRVFAVVVSILAQEGYVIATADRSLGIASGTQNAPVDVFAGTLTGTEGMVKQVTVQVQPVTDGGSLVRATFNITLMKSGGRQSTLSATSTTTSDNRNRFFAALGAALSR